MSNERKMSANRLLEPSFGGLDFDMYKNARKLVDDAKYYSMQTSDYKLFKAGALLLHKKIWPELPLDAKRFGLSDNEIKKGAVILDYYKDILKESLNSGNYNEMTLRSMKLWSDIVSYAIEPQHDRFTLLRQVIANKPDVLRLGDYTELKIEWPSHNQAYLYHPAFFDSSTLCRCTELSIKSKNGSWVIGSEEEIREAFKIVRKSLEEFPSFEYDFDSDNYSGLSEEEAFDKFAHESATVFTPERPEYYRIVLDTIAMTAWDKRHLDSEAHRRDSKFLEWSSGGRILKHHVIDLNDGGYIIDPNFNAADVFSAHNYSSERYSKYSYFRNNDNFETSDISISNYERYFSELYNEIELCVDNQMITPNSRILEHIPRNTLDMFVLFGSKPEIYEKFKEKRELFDNTFYERLNDYKNINKYSVFIKHYEDNYTKYQPELGIVPIEDKPIYPEGITEYIDVLVEYFENARRRIDNGENISEEQMREDILQMG